MPFLMTFKAKANLYGGLERHKAICAIRGDRMIPNIHLEKKGGVEVIVPAFVGSGPACCITLSKALEIFLTFAHGSD